MKPLRHPAAHVRRLMVSPQDSVCAWLFRARFRAPEDTQAHRRARSVVEPALQVRRLSYGHKRDLSGSLVTRPVPLPCSQTPAEPVILAIAAFPMLPPRPTRRRLRRSMISRLPQGFSTRCLRFTSGVAVTHARLASGRRAPPLPGGRRSLWVTMKGFRSHPSSFPGLVLTQVGPTRGASFTMCSKRPDRRSPKRH